RAPGGLGGRAAREPAPGPALPRRGPAPAGRDDPRGVPREARGGAAQGQRPQGVGPPDPLPPRGRPEGAEAGGRGGTNPGKHRERIRGERMGGALAAPSQGGQAMKAPRILTIAALGALALLCTAPASAYIEAPYSLGRLVAESTNIMIVQVDKVDKENNRILYKKIRDVKGTHPTDVLRHNIAKAGFHPREWQNCMAWAEPGKLAMFFYN